MSNRDSFILSALFGVVWGLVIALLIVPLFVR